MAFKVVLGACVYVIIYGVTCLAYVLEPKVRISQGTVVGSPTKDGYYEFHGIPYADSASGINRFQAPSPPPIFRNEFKSNRKNVKCLKAAGKNYEGIEDCLVLDIFTPTLNSTRRLPVMVWIKGNEFDAGLKMEKSWRFMQKDVIVIDLHFRESILGFLCLGTKRAPGNAGLKDIIAGLKMIKQEVSLFGGDPDNIVLVGHGSGAAAVDLVTLSPMAEGLVHKVITQSGTALSPWAVTRNNLKYAIQVAEALGHFYIGSLDTLSDVLTQASTPALMAAINELDLTDNSLAFAPCIERKIENEEAFMLKSPYETIMSGEQMKIPFITGFVDFEGTIRANEGVHDEWLDRMQYSFIDFLQSDIGFDSYKDEETTLEIIRDFYFRNESIDITLIDDFLQYIGDTMVLVSAIREARMRAKTSTSPVYLYQFSYKGKRSEELFTRPVRLERAGHSEELVYMFSNENDLTDLDLTVGDILIERWTNFAKTGEPTSETSNVIWLPYQNPTASNFLRITDDHDIVENSDVEANLIDPHPRTMAFWDEIYSQFFVDAISRWELPDRNEDATTEPTTTPYDEDNSASITVGYTFGIIFCFAVLQKVLSIISY